MGKYDSIYDVTIDVKNSLFLKKESFLWLDAIYGKGLEKFLLYVPNGGVVHLFERKNSHGGCNLSSVNTSELPDELLYKFNDVLGEVGAPGYQRFPIKIHYKMRYENGKRVFVDNKK